MDLCKLCLGATLEYIPQRRMSRQKRHGSYEPVTRGLKSNAAKCMQAQHMTLKICAHKHLRLDLGFQSSLVTGH